MPSDEQRIAELEAKVARTLEPPAVKTRADLPAFFRWQEEVWLPSIARLVAPPPQGKPQLTLIEGGGEDA